MKDILKLVKKEGDRKNWTYTTKNGLEFDCSIRRVSYSGHLCGYVTLTPDNDYFGMEYGDIPVDCHGGLTYANSSNSSTWVIGFDCSHLGDLQPLSEYGWSAEGVYRDMEFVTMECESICEQIAEKSKAHKRFKKINELL